MPTPAPTAGQPVTDVRTGRTGRIDCVPSPYSPFILVAFFDDPEAHSTIVSLEFLAYGYHDREAI